MSTEDLGYSLKSRILTATLPLIPELGWSLEALKQGCLQAGLETWNVDRVFYGVGEAIEFWNEECTRAMEALYSGDSLKVRERIEALVMARLDYFSPHREALCLSVKYLGSHLQFARKTRILYNAVNAMWYQAGDQSTDYNFYSKRLLLSGVYTSTMAYWLKTKDREATQAFLRARIENVMGIGRFKAKVGNFVAGLCGRRASL